MGIHVAPVPLRRSGQGTLPDDPDPSRQVYTLPAPAVFAALTTSPAGLPEAEAAVRLQHYGPNAISEVKGTPLALRLLSNFTHLMALLLWAGGLIGFLAGLPQLGIAIWLVNLINGLFSFWQEYKAERATAMLRRLLPAYARVIRDGKEQRILAEALVFGDVMVLAEGDHISADGRLVEEADLRVDQSILTGESHPVRKTCEAVTNADLARIELPNLVFAGTSVAAGSGLAVVCATGMQTAFGTVARLTQTVGEAPSPLQRELAQTTRVVTLLAVGIGALFFVLALALAGFDLASGFIFALGMIVAFVPEGLLPTVTLALALSVQRMARRHALVKRLSSVETLGCTTVICTDKTGTLTQNAMTVRGLWLAGRMLTVNGIGYAPEGQILDQDRVVSGQRVECRTQSAEQRGVSGCQNDPKARPDAQIGVVSGQYDADLHELLLAASLCCDARLLPPNDDSPHWTALGDPTEAALLVVAAKGGLNLQAEATRQPRLRVLPFDSHRKRMTTIHAGLARGECIAYVKGAPGEVLARCVAFHSDGADLPLTEALRAQVASANDSYARNGLRVLAVARRRIAAGETIDTPEAVEHDLTLLGLTAMQDPPRPEVTDAVAQCRRAGIRIIMITGDYGLTAESIARRIGIVSSPQVTILSGADLDKLDDVALAEATRGEVIFARVAPEHKLRVVRALQSRGEVVAVTGDGVNDAPALKQADIGVAMGIGGSDVAKEAADIVLTDDNFASIVSAVEEGRSVYANIRRFVSYIFTSNTPEAVPFVCFALSGGSIPLALTVMQVLAIDLGTDMLPALALGAEPPAAGAMDRPPRHLSEHVITRALLVRAFLWLGMLESAAAMVAFYGLYWTQGFWGRWLDLPASGPIYQAATTATLAAVVLSQVGNLIVHRVGEQRLWRTTLPPNRLVGIGIVVEVLLLLAIIYAPWLQVVFGTLPFPLAFWVLPIACAPALLLLDELRKGKG